MKLIIASRRPRDDDGELKYYSSHDDEGNKTEHKIVEDEYDISK